jgi:type IV pilus assembly protein PilA
VLRARLALLREGEEGFTLIELMVVVMILAILIVMGLPTFLGVRVRFEDRAAQSDLRNTVLSARILFTDNATFTSANETASGLVTIVPNMCYVAGGTASAATGTVPCASGVGGGSISVASTVAQFSAARLSSSTSCFVILDAVTGTQYGKTTVANCNATWAGAAGNVTATTPAAAGW